MRTIFLAWMIAIGTPAQADQTAVQKAFEANCSVPLAIDGNFELLRPEIELVYSTMIFTLNEVGEVFEVKTAVYEAACKAAPHISVKEALRISLESIRQTAEQ